MTNQQILAVQLGGISEGPAINLPAVENLRRNICSACQERNLPPPPINIAAIPVLPIEFQTTRSEDQFLFFDSGAGAADKIIAFVSVQARQLLVQSENWYGDGTFKVCPEIFYKLTLFTRNAVVEFFRASLLSYPIKRNLLTEG